MSDSSGAIEWSHYRPSTHYLANGRVKVTLAEFGLEAEGADEQEALAAFRALLSTAEARAAGRRVFGLDDGTESDNTAP